MITRRGVLVAGSAACILTPLGGAWAAGHQGIERILRDRLQAGVTPVQKRALVGTLGRLASAALPAQGRLVLVNSAACTLDAYQDGQPVMSMRVGCGMRRLPTPSMNDTAGTVLLNPWWTLPPAVLHDPEWRAALADPVFFRQWGFSRRDGRIMQAPGPRNLLGCLKIRMGGGGSIYLHDTNERGSFARSERHFTHGCVRLQHPVALASWLLQRDEQALAAAIAGGSQEVVKPGVGAAVTLAYFTAWPDADGTVAFHPDHYGLDGGARTEESHPRAGPSW